MSYFPFFVDLEGREGLIVGGGVVALRKVRKLLPYGPCLTVAALTFHKELWQIDEISLLQAPFSVELLDEKYFVIAATDDQELNHRISRLCQERNILVNAVDDKDACTFLFPSLVKRGRLSVGISTEGASPSAAVYIKNQFHQQIPERFDEILEFLESKREVVKAGFLEEKERSELFARLFLRCMEEGRALTEAEFQKEKESRGKKAVEGKGCVYLVGAGCGEADLITVKGLKLLKTCEVLMYDDLIAPELLAQAPEEAEKIYVGKRCGRHSASQEEICRLLAEKAGEGKMVVRLKGGDPFVFGRGGEEMKALAEAGILCQEVPGVTSAIGIPAAAGIPVTYRGISQSVHIITAHTADTSDGLPEYLEALAGLPGTLVFLMGLGQLDKITEKLTEAGKDKTTPVAVISGSMGACPETVRGTLETISEEVKEQQITAPAVIVIGDVAAIEVGRSLE